MRSQPVKNRKMFGDETTVGMSRIYTTFLWYSLKWRCFKCQTIPRLTLDYKTRRINFAKNKDSDWSKVMFTDESPFNLYYVPNKKNDIVWGSQEHSVPRAQQVKFSPRVMVWGGITAQGLTNLHIIPQKMNVNSNYYIHEILEKEVKPAFSRTQTSTDNCNKAVFSRR